MYVTRYLCNDEMEMDLTVTRSSVGWNSASNVVYLECLPGEKQINTVALS